VHITSLTAQRDLLIRLITEGFANERINVSRRDTLGEINDAASQFRMLKKEHASDAPDRCVTHVDRRGVSGNMLCMRGDYNQPRRGYRTDCFNGLHEPNDTVTGVVLDIGEIEHATQRCDGFDGRS
jgi:hypothetical protein